MSNILIDDIEDLDIIIEENHVFDISKKKYYLDLFNTRIQEGKIRETTCFDDDKWIVKFAGIEQTVVFANDIELKSLSELFDRSITEFKLAYKSFLLLNFHYNALFSFNLDIRAFGRDIINFKFDSNTIKLFKDFIGYIKIKETKMEFFQKKFEDFNQRIYNIRTLPNFEDIFLMTDIINDIIENKKLIDYKEYLLTIMWWKICSVLPLRPTEFLRTQFNCIYIENDKYYLKVKRSKGKSGDRIKNSSKIEDFYNEDIITIDKGLFNLIQEYKDILINEFNYIELTELFPYKLKVNKVKRNLNSNIFTYEDLDNNINNFYNNVVKKEYGFDPIPKYIKKEDKKNNYIEKTLPYDLRHIAIMNLVLIGTDILEVMYLAGHKNVNTAYSYFNHVKEFSRGYALNYARKTSTKGFVSDNSLHSEHTKIRRNEEFNRILRTIKGNKISPQKVKGGHCYYSKIQTDKTLCFKYERNHNLCEYFIADSKKIIEDEIKVIETNLDSDIKILKDLVQDIKGISKFNELYQTTSYRISLEIQELSLLNRKLLEE